MQRLCVIVEVEQFATAAPAAATLLSEISVLATLPLLLASPEVPPMQRAAPRAIPGVLG